MNEEQVKQLAHAMTSDVCEPDILFGAISEVIRVNQDEQATLEQWCLAMEFLSEICRLMSTYECISRETGEENESPNNDLHAPGDETARSDGTEFTFGDLFR